MRDIAAIPDHEIELSGGALALDFANTVGGTHVRPTHDHLRGYADVLRFAVMAGGLKDDVAKRLAVRAEREPMRAAAVYELGIALREAVWAVFSFWLILLLVWLVHDFFVPPRYAVDARFALFAIEGYQAHVSPHLSGVVQCRFTPTCSYYGRESIRKHGLLIGGAKTLWRIARCGPWTPLHTPDQP